MGISGFSKHLKIAAMSSSSVIAIASYLMNYTRTEELDIQNAEGSPDHIVVYETLC